MASGQAKSRRAPPFIDPPGYARHCPEQTLLYQLIEQRYSAFVAAREAADRPLPKHVREEFESYLGRLTPRPPTDLTSIPRTGSRGRRFEFPIRSRPRSRQLQNAAREAQAVELTLTSSFAFSGTNTVLACRRV